jgi:hypothetical protein
MQAATATANDGRHFFRAQHSPVQSPERTKEKYCTKQVNNK